MLCQSLPIKHNRDLTGSNLAVLDERCNQPEPIWAVDGFDEFVGCLPSGAALRSPPMGTPLV
jgi:hypothetical protein